MVGPHGLGQDPEHVGPHARPERSWHVLEFAVPEAVARCDPLAAAALAFVSLGVQRLSRSLTIRVLVDAPTNSPGLRESTVLARD